MTDELKLAPPSNDHKDQILAYRKEFLSLGETIHGSSTLEAEISIDQWIDRTLKNRDEATVQEGYVPATTYLVVRESDNKLVGIVQVRHKLNDHLFVIGGHIGYSVRASERRKGYAKMILKQALVKCREFGIAKALITCDKENIGSGKTILANGGILEKEVPYEGYTLQRYWVTL